MDKIAQLTSSQASGSSFLTIIGLEENCQFLSPILVAMREIEELQTLAEEILAALSKRGTILSNLLSILLHNKLYQDS